MMQRLIVLAMLAMGGCADGLYAQYPVTKSASSADALIRFKDAAFRTAKVARVHHLDAFEHVEYARFETDELTLEAVYDTALGDGFVLQYDYWMERMVNTWNVHRGEEKVWGPKADVWAWHGELDYQPFRLVSSRRECVGFNSEWGYQPRDSFGRPARVFFGYVCAKPEAKLSEKRIAAILTSVTISTRPGESFFAPGTRRQVDQLAFNTARGVAGSDTGNAEFPFNFGTPLEESENGSEKHN